MSRPADALSVSTTTSGDTIIHSWSKTGTLSKTFSGSVTQGPSSCRPHTVSICGVNYDLPLGIEGAFVNYTLPGRFVNSSFTMHCEQNGPYDDYFIMGVRTDTEIAKFCALKSCAPGIVDLCDHHFMIDAQTPAGDTVELPVPQKLLENLNGKPEPTFNAQCIGDGDTTHYVVTSSDHISCSSFLCVPTTLSVCGTALNLTEYATAGTVLHDTTPNGDAVTVSCLGSGGQALVYQVTDHSCR